MLTLSYVAAAAAMIAAAFYLVLRLRPFITTTTMFVGLLLLIYGPAFLSFTLSSGQYALLIRPFTEGGLPAPSIFPAIHAKGLDLNAIVIAMNFSVALMYVGVIVGIEIVNRAAPLRTAMLAPAVAGWNDQKIEDDVRTHPILLLAILALTLLMLYFSMSEHHIETILHFFSIKDDNAARNLFRAHFGGSPNYWYRLILAAVAPMFVIWGLLAGLLSRSWPLVAVTCLLLAATMLGKIETLSKAPPVFFVFQIMFAALLAFTNKISWRVALFGSLFAALLIYVAVLAFIIFYPGQSVVELAYSRIFEVENDTLLENFAVFPYLHPFMWGANLRPIAALMGVPYEPAFNLVGYIWYGSHDITSPSLFIADAWADFSYAGVIAYSIIAGTICRVLDIVFLVRGKTVVGVAVLGATLVGVLTLLTTALNIALISGGLLLAPVLAGALMIATRGLNRAA
jgi:hypothetical protein